MNCKSILLSSLVFAAACMVSCNKEETADQALKRDTDAVSIAYNTGATGKISVRYKGSWSASSSESWLTLTPASSTGNGKDYEYITLTADRNLGKARTCTVTITPSAGNPAKVTVTQEDGIFSSKAPVINGTLKKGSPSSAYISVLYQKARGGEPVEVTVTLSGNSAGLSVSSPHSVTIASEGDGEITIPITGTAEAIGTLTASVNVKISGEETFSGSLEASISSDNTIYTFSFDKFIWGGDYVANKAGKTANADNTQVRADYDYSADPSFTAVNGTLTANTDGTVDCFGTMKDAYRIARGIADWSGSAIYERPGYVKVGTGSKSGWIMTPPLSGLSTPGDVTFSFDACRWQGENMTYYITAENGGTVIGGTLDASKLPAPASAADRKWTTITVTVKNATSDTRLKITAEDLKASGGRLFLDNFTVSGGAEARTEQLEAISADEITVTEAASAITFSWPAVQDATGYSISLANTANPEFKNAQKVEGTKYTFESLPPMTAFVFTIKALYDLDNSLDSETTSVNASTGKAMAILSAPKVTLYGTPTYASGIISISGYDEGENTELFDLVLEKNGTAVQTYSFTFSTGNKAKYAKHGIRYQFSGLEAGTEYTAKVKRQPIDSGNYKESENGTITFTTSALPDKSGYLLWQDFNLHPWGGNGPVLAFGIAPSGSNKDFNVITGVSEWSLASPVKNMDNLGNGVGTNIDGGISHYHNTYMPGWDDAELTAATITKTVYLCGGMMKFGTGSSAGLLTLPAFDASSVSVTFDAAPYMEPNKDTGLFEASPAVKNGESFSVEITGAGTLTADGTVSADGKATLSNKSAAELGADALGYLPYTPHTLKITGMDASTRICIKTKSKTDGRMWLDNLKVKAE